MSVMGDRIRASRKAKGWSMEKLGNEIGCTKYLIYSYECGRITNIPLNRINEMADALGVDAIWLSGWKEIQNERRETEIASITKTLEQHPEFIKAVRSLLDSLVEQD